MSVYYRLPLMGDVADWIVLSRSGDRAHIYSNRLGTDLHCDFKDLELADRSVAGSLLAADDPARHDGSSTAGPGSSLPGPAVCSAPTATSPGSGGQPRARVTDPVTAHHAADRARHKLTENQRAVLQAHAQAGPQGLTGDEMADLFGGEHTYPLYGPRRPQLERAGLLEKAGMRNNRRNNPVTVYRCTEAGYAAAEKVVA